MGKKNEHQGWASKVSAMANTTVKRGVNCTNELDWTVEWNNWKKMAHWPLVILPWSQGLSLSELVNK